MFLNERDQIRIGWDVNFRAILKIWSVKCRNMWPKGTKIILKFRIDKDHIVLQ